MKIPILGTIIPDMGMKATVELSDALFSKTRRRVLVLLFGNSDHSYYLNEIVRHADSGIGAVQRELDRLLRSGLATVEKQGNQKHFRANPASPIFDELRSIVRKSFDITEVLRATLAPVMRQMQQAFVFGPAARGDADGEVDLLVVSETLGYPDILPLLQHVRAELGRTVNLHVFKPAEIQAQRKAGNAFLKRVWKQPRLPLVEPG